MENEIIRVEEGQLIIATDIINKIKELELKKKKIDEIQKTYKETILNLMDEYNIKGFESNDKTLKITRTESAVITKFDETRFSREQHDLYLQYLKDVDRKSSLRITVREVKE